MEKWKVSSQMVGDAKKYQVYKKKVSGTDHAGSRLYVGNLITAVKADATKAADALNNYEDPMENLVVLEVEGFKKGANQYLIITEERELVFGINMEGRVVVGGESVNACKGRIERSSNL